MSNCLCLWFNRFSDLSGVVHSQPLPFTAIFHFVIFPLQRKELKNFTCRWGGEVYMFLQYIIYRVTILVARFVMQHWTKKYREIFDMTALMVAHWKWDITSRITWSRWSPAAWEDMAAKEKDKCTDQRMARVCYKLHQPRPVLKHHTCLMLFRFSKILLAWYLCITIFPFTNYSSQYFLFFLSFCLNKSQTNIQASTTE